MIYAQLWLLWARLSKDVLCYRSFLYFKCFKLDGPNSISQFFNAIMGNYNLRGSGLNVVWPSYNNLVMHSSFLYKISNMWNQLPAITKSQTIWAQFCFRLNGVEFVECQRMNCIIFLLKFLLMDDVTSMSLVGSGMAIAHSLTHSLESD